MESNRPELADVDTCCLQAQLSSATRTECAVHGSGRQSDVFATAASFKSRWYSLSSACYNARCRAPARSASPSRPYPKRHDAWAHRCSRTSSCTFMHDFAYHGNLTSNLTWNVHGDRGQGWRASRQHCPKLTGPRTDANNAPSGIGGAIRSANDTRDQKKMVEGMLS